MIYNVNVIFLFTHKQSITIGFSVLFITINIQNNKNLSKSAYFDTSNRLIGRDELRLTDPRLAIVRLSRQTRYSKFISLEPMNLNLR